MHENWWWCRQRHPVNCAISSLIIYEGAACNMRIMSAKAASKQKIQQQQNKRTKTPHAHIRPPTQYEDLLKNRINFEQVLNSLLIHCVYEFIQFVCFGSVAAYYCCAESSFCLPLSSFFVSLSLSIFFFSFSLYCFSAFQCSSYFLSWKKTENKLKSLCRMDAMWDDGLKKKFHPLIMPLKWSEWLRGFQMIDLVYFCVFKSPVVKIAPTWKKHQGNRSRSRSQSASQCFRFEIKKHPKII